jgi:nicotinamidase-related amidase
MPGQLMMPVMFTKNRLATTLRRAATLLAVITMTTHLTGAPLSLTLRERGETTNTWRKVEWDPGKTAIIVCDMWDSHHSVTAVRRVNEFAPRLNAVLNAARERGAIIIHSPSDCMPAYKTHPARKRALAVQAAKDSPPDMGAWCHRIPTEEKAAYPIDQSDGGEDESKWENDQWAARLEADGRKAGTPWLKQNALLEIADSDYISSEGDLVWNILQDRGIEHVILAGVHTNMCVLGRPFGLRQMVRAGMDTVLLRDCTDVMYNPARWPYVSHFTGLDLVIGHIEQHVCPTITSDQIVGGEPFHFGHDQRPHLLVFAGTPEARRELRAFSRRFLAPTFRVSFGNGGPNRNPHLDTADAVLATGGNVPAGIGSRPLIILGGKGDSGKFIRSDGGRSINLTSDTFVNPAFQRSLFEAVHWATDQPIPAELPQDPDVRRTHEGWSAPGPAAPEAKYRDLRTLLRTPTKLKPDKRFVRWNSQPEANVFLNGKPLEKAGQGKWKINESALRAGDLNLLVFRLSIKAKDVSAVLAPPPEILDGKSVFALDTVHWQERCSSDEQPDTRFPIPPQFGAPTDLIQNWPK